MKNIAKELPQISSRKVPNGLTAIGWLDTGADIEKWL